MAATALVTGLSGFTGRYLALELEALGYEVHGLGQGESSAPRCHRVDLRDLVGLTGIVKAIQPQVGQKCRPRKARVSPVTLTASAGKMAEP